MLKIEDMYLQIKNCKLEFDKKGTPFLKCKAFSKGTIGVREKEKIEEYGEKSKPYIKGSNWFSSTKLYGDLPELEKFLEHFNEEKKANPKALVRTYMQEGYIRTYVVGSLLTVLYVFDFKPFQKRKRTKKPSTKKVVKKRVVRTKKIYTTKPKEVEVEEKETNDYANLWDRLSGIE